MRNQTLQLFYAQLKTNRFLKKIKSQQEQVLDDELYARMLQDELFVQQLQADPDFESIFGENCTKQKKIITRNHIHSSTHFKTAVRRQSNKTQTQPRTRVQNVATQQPETDFIDDVKKLGDGNTNRILVSRSNSKPLPILLTEMSKQSQKKTAAKLKIKELMLKFSRKNQPAQPTQKTR